MNDTERQRFQEAGMRAYLALGLPRSTTLSDFTEALYAALDGKKP